MTEPLRNRAADDEQGRRRERERPPSPEPLPHPVVDNHCHLDIADGDWLETSEAVRRAAEVGVRRIVQIGCDLPGAQWAVDAAREHDALVAGVALHPNEAPRLAADGVRGEVTVVVSGSVTSAIATDPESLLGAVAAAEETGLTRKDAIRAVATRTGVPKRTVYDAVHGVGGPDA